MKMTHKAIARAAGYRVVSFYGNYQNSCNVWMYWENKEYTADSGLECFLTEQEAYADCCKVNGLTHE